MARRHAEQYAKLEQAVMGNATLAAQLTAWQSPPADDSESIRRLEEMNARRAENARETEARDQSWVNLIAEGRNDPDFFNRQIASNEDQIDRRLYHLWQFATSRTSGRDRYALESLDALEPTFGPDLTRRFSEALIDFANNRTQLDSAGAASIDRNSANAFDLMALSGMALAADSKMEWARNLDPDCARRAAQLARIELNGFPSYLGRLAESHPETVRAALWEEAEAQLSSCRPETYGMLDKLRNADAVFSRLIWPDLELYLTAHLSGRLRNVIFLPWMRAGGGRPPALVSNSRMFT